MLRNSLLSSELTSSIDTINVVNESNEQVMALSVEDKIMRMKCKSNWETGLWINGLRNAVETQKIIARTQNNMLRFNITTLYALFSNKRDNEILKFANSITEGLVMGLTPLQFAGEFKNVAKDFSSLADAFYAQKPFVLALFKFMVLTLHTQVRTLLKCYWNQFYQVLKSAETLSIASALFVYERTLIQWGIIDYNFTWTDAVQSTFIAQLFDNSKTPMTNIILEFEKNTFNENNKLHSNSCSALESHVFFLLGSYKEVSLNSFSEKLCHLVSKVLSAVFVQIICFLLFKEYQSQIYIAILNNYFMKMLKNFEKKIHSDTKSQLSLQTIRELIGEHEIIKLLNMLENIAVKKLRQLWRKEIGLKFANQESIFDFDIENKLSLLLSTYENNLKMIVLKCHMDELLFEMFDTLISLYYDKFVAFCQNVDTKNHKLLSEILQKGLRILQAFFEVHHFEKAENMLRKFRQLRDFFETDDIDECLTGILNMTVYSRKLANNSSIFQLLKCKIYFPDSSINYARNYLEKSLKVDEYQRKIHKFVNNSVLFNGFFHKTILKFSLINRRNQRA